MVTKKSGKLGWLASGQGGTDRNNVRMTPTLTGEVLVWPEAYSGDVVGLDVNTGTVRFRDTVGACFFPSWAARAGC